MPFPGNEDVPQVSISCASCICDLPLVRTEGFVLCFSAEDDNTIEIVRFRCRPYHTATDQYFRHNSTGSGIIHKLLQLLTQREATVGLDEATKPHAELDPRGGVQSWR